MKQLLPLLFLFTGLLFGCKSNTTSVQGIPGDLTGYVQVYDTLYQEMTDNSGVKISLEGTGFSTLSDAAGKWTLSNVPPGTYTLAFSRDRYAISKFQNTQYTGNGTLYLGLRGLKTPVYPIPSLFPNIVIRPFEDLVKITYRGDTIIKNNNSGDSSQYRELYDTVITKFGIAYFSSHSQYSYHGQRVSSTLFLGTHDALDPSVPSSYLLRLPGYQNDTSGVSTFTLLRTDLLKAGFTPGSTIYCSAFNYINDVEYWDPLTDKAVYTAYSPYHSEVQSVQFP